MICISEVSEVRLKERLFMTIKAWVLDGEPDVSIWDGYVECLTA